MTTLEAQLLSRCRHVVHVGANTGQERDLYERHGLSVTWIEPIPEVFNQLVQNIEPYPRQTAIQALLTDRRGEMVKLNIANNCGGSSSILDLALHRDIWPDVDYVDAIEMEAETLDGLIERGAVLLPVDGLILDTQGSELLVLKGATTVLRKALYLKVEAADFESYKGCATVDDLVEFLGDFSFDLVAKNRFARHPAGGSYYDLLFQKLGGVDLLLRRVRGLFLE